MSRMESLRAEFAHEAHTTRRMLERVADAQLDWRPHEKSFTLRGLTSHLVDIIRWTSAMFDQDEFDFEPATFRHYEAASRDDLLETFDRDVAAGLASMARASDDEPERIWRFKMRGKVRFEKTKDDAFRDFTVSHLIHHRGQLSVYLRLLDLPVPRSYGPTADEPF